MSFDFNLRQSPGVQRLGEFRFQVAAHRWAGEVEPIMLEAIKRKAPVSKGGGRIRGKVHLRDTFQAHRRATATGVSIEFTSTSKVARYVLKGTKPHIIQPRNARALYWVSGGGGHFARLVHHPGTKPNPFVQRAVRPLVPLLTRRFEDIVARALKG